RRGTSVRRGPCGQAARGAADAGPAGARAGICARRLPRPPRPRGGRRAGTRVSLGGAAPAAPVPPMNQQLATWLGGHGLRYGMSTYWQSSIVSLATGEHVMVVPVATATKTAGSIVRRDEWESTEDWYDPRRHYANF